MLGGHVLSCGMVGLGFKLDSWNGNQVYSDAGSSLGGYCGSEAIRHPEEADDQASISILLSFSARFTSRMIVN